MDGFSFVFILPVILFVATVFYTQQYKYMLQCLCVGILCSMYPLVFLGLIFGLPSVILATSILGIIRYNKLD